MLRKRDAGMRVDEFAQLPEFAVRDVQATIVEHGVDVSGGIVLVHHSSRPIAIFPEWRQPATSRVSRIGWYNGCGESRPKTTNRSG